MESTAWRRFFSIDTIISLTVLALGIVLLWVSALPLHDDAYQVEGYALPDLDAARAHRDQAIALFESEKYEQALGEIDQAIDADRGDETLLIWRASTYIQLGRLEEAIEDCQRAIDLNPDNPYPYEIEGDVYAARGELEAAIDRYSRVLGIDGTKGDVFLKRGHVYLENGEQRMAFIDFMQASRLLPGNALARRMVQQTGGVAH